MGDADFGGRARLAQGVEGADAVAVAPLAHLAVQVGRGRHRLRVHPCAVAVDVVAQQLKPLAGGRLVRHVIHEHHHAVEADAPYGEVLRAGRKGERELGPFVGDLGARCQLGEGGGVLVGGGYHEPERLRVLDIVGLGPEGDRLLLAAQARGD